MKDPGTTEYDQPPWSGDTDSDGFEAGVRDAASGITYREDAPFKSFYFLAGYERGKAFMTQHQEGGKDE